MTNKQRMKRLVSLRHALVLSICSMILCVSMLAGSTFAWFSDSASTAPETITAGNLQVELLKYDKENSNGGENNDGYVAVGEKNPLIPTEFRWEPGKVLTLPLAVKNNGSLAASCNVILTVQNGGLADVMEYIVLDEVEAKSVENRMDDWEFLTKSLAEVYEETQPLADSPDEVSLSTVSAAKIEEKNLEGIQAVVLLGNDSNNSESSIMLEPSGTEGDGDIHYFTLAIHMKNENDFGAEEPHVDLMSYRLSNIKLNLMVNAVQSSKQSDSFGDGYDDDLPLPVPHTYYLAGFDSDKSALKEKNVMSDAVQWNGLVNYILNNGNGEQEETDAKTKITKVVFGRWNEQKDKLDGAAWESGVSIGAQINTKEGDEVNSNDNIKGFYNSEKKELYILVQDAMGFIAVKNTMGHRTSGGYFTKWTALTSVDLTCLNTYDVKGKDDSNKASMAGMFEGCENLTEVKFGSGFVTSGVADMQKMFYGCKKLTSLDLSMFNTTNVTDMSAMFYGCEALTELNLKSFNTSKVTSIVEMIKEGDSRTYYGLFENCKVLQTLTYTPSVFTFEKTTSMRNMFRGCAALTSLDFSGFKTSNVTDMESMFYDCKKLLNLDLSSFNTSKVTTMNQMFRNCSALQSVDVSSFDVSQVTKMNAMFQRCENLTELDLSSFNTDRTVNIEGMFMNCKELETIWATEPTGDGVDTPYKGFLAASEKINVFTGCDKLNQGEDVDAEARDEFNLEDDFFNPSTRKYLKSPSKLTSSDYAYVGRKVPIFDSKSGTLPGWFRNINEKKSTVPAA